MTPPRAAAAAPAGSERVPASTPTVVDMHCHLDFAPDPRALARRGAGVGASFYSCTVSPAGYQDALGPLGAQANVRVGVGLHPWWLADGRCGEADVERVEGLVASARFVGEVGLDFSARCLGGQDPTRIRELQLGSFERICAVAARTGARLVSIHAVRATTDVLDVLERTRANEACPCVLHWFSGTSDELTRARRLGCYFSVNPRMLASKRGRAYTRSMDAGRILLETDLPASPDAPCAADEMASSLRETLAQLELLRGEGLAARILGTSRELLELGL